jgi:ketosteroid isomerase-like protein
VKDYSAIIQAFFSAYDAHDVAGMLAQCSSDAQARYVPYGRENVVPIRGGIDAVWHGFTQAVPDFRVEVFEVIPSQVNIVVAQVILGGTMPVDVPGIVKKGQIGRFPHAFILRFDHEDKISHIDCYWDNTATNFLKASAL